MLPFVLTGQLIERIVMGADGREHRVYASPPEDTPVALDQESRDIFYEDHELPYEELCAAAKAGEATRSLRRDRRVSCAVTRLRDAAEPLGVEYEFTAHVDWTKCERLWPIAEDQMHLLWQEIWEAIIALRSVLHEIAAHLIELAVAASIRLRPRRTLTTGPPPTELVKSHPDAARAPNRLRVALTSDVLATAA
jgi:hypothetical protein